MDCLNGVLECPSAQQVLLLLARALSIGCMLQGHSTLSSESVRNLFYVKEIISITFSQSSD
jgi:hypothetical protein